MRLLLFMTRGMSLEAWQKNGSLSRELALYEKMSQHGIKVGIISWGEREDLDIARQFPWLRVYGNVHNLPQARYERLMPLLHAMPLIKADVIKCNQTCGGNLALRCAHFWRKPFVARCGFVWSEFVGKEHPDLLEQALHLEREVFSKCHKAIVTSKEATRYLSCVHGVSPDRFICIPNYVSDSFYTASLPNYQRPSPVIITQVGRLAPQKNLFALLEACAGMDVTVRLVGDGEEKGSLEAYAQKLGVVVEFKGNVPHERLPELLAESTVCTLVSHYEGHPKALIEYMACGCPVLATNVTGINTVVQDDVSGILCNISASSIRAGLEKLLKDPALRARLGRQAREEAKRYSLDAIFVQEREIYTAFPRMASLRKWATALRVVAGYGKRKCRSLFADATSVLSKRIPYGSMRQDAQDTCNFSSLPEEQALAYLEEKISGLIADKSPAAALRLLFTLDAKLYAKQGSLAVAYGGGVHTKHRHTKYHDFFVNRVKKDETVLDIGCGIGALAHSMVKAGALVTGIDISEANIQTARERFAHTGVTYICGNALKDLPAGAYETIVLSNVLEHLPERPAFLRSLQERLNPRRYLIRVPLFEREWRVPLKKELGVEWRLDITHETEYTLESFAEEMEKAHLRVVHQEVRWSEVWCEICPR